MEHSGTRDIATNQKKKFSSIKDEIEFRVANRIATDEEFDIHSALRELLENFGLTPEDTGGNIIFEGKDPIVPSTIKFASASALGLTAKAVAIAKLWKYRTGETQDIKVDLRKVIHRLSPFFQGKWEKLNGFSPGFPTEISSPFSPHFYKTRDDRYVMPLDFYNRLRISMLKFLNVPEDKEAIAQAILKWNSDELEEKANAEGLVLTKLRSVQEFFATAQFEVLEKLSIIQIEKIGDSDPVPFTSNPSTPLDGVRALGMGHVIAGAGTGRGLALHGADVLNIWFRPGIIHATVSLFGEQGPWASHGGFDVSAGVATGIMAMEGTLENPQLPSIMVVDDYLVAWLLTTAIVATLVRRAEEGGSYKIHCSLSRTVLWMYQLGVFDKEFAKSIAGKSPGHEFMDPDLFTADTPMGKYQGLTEQVFMSRTPGHYKYALLPRGASNPVWEKEHREEYGFKK